MVYMAVLETYVREGREREENRPIYLCWFLLLDKMYVYHVKLLSFTQTILSILQTHKIRHIFYKLRNCRRKLSSKDGWYATKLKNAQER